MLSRYIKFAGVAGLAALVAAAPAFAQEAAAAAAAPFTPTAEMVNKGDTVWMLTSSALVLMMSVPALALFYGGLVRAKNMLSLLMQVLTIVCIASLVW
ncbi:MAG TPA: ammonia channel protein, partial [Sphingomicrobium sp.]|nr:ammonia channel protein [Sphingomicrobium sp.]